ncbi:MAG: DUF4124 domain-containing protein [Gammaproteobacteria bacterium]|nr:DUF4124 domain-containing protein [Gammaproteobacteria bacterium]
MHHWRPLFALGMFVCTACPAAVIYKWTDASGIIHYADQPVPGAQRIEIVADVPTHGTPSPPAETAAPSRPSAPPAVVPYTAFAITSPAPEQAFVSIDVPVQLSLQPKLQPAHALVWTLNGSTLTADAGLTSFSLADLPRGAYTLSAAIVDRASGTTQNSASVIFYVHRPSLLMPHHKH